MIKIIDQLEAIFLEDRKMYNNDSRSCSRHVKMVDFKQQISRLFSPIL